MRISGLWRYPVKSMPGERLERAYLKSSGIAGDCAVHVEDENGRIITARTHPGLLGHHATLVSRGEPLVDAESWKEQQVRQKVVDIVGPGARLIQEESEYRVDTLPLLVATDGAISALVMTEEGCGRTLSWVALMGCPNVHGLETYLR